MAHSPFVTDRLERLSRDLHALRHRCAEPARSTREADARIDEGERIAADLRAVFRG